MALSLTYYLAIVIQREDSLIVRNYLLTRKGKKNWIGNGETKSVEIAGYFLSVVKRVFLRRDKYG